MTDVRTTRSDEPVRTTYDAVELTEQGTPRRGFDAATALTVYVALLILIPSDRVVPGLGNLGAPAVLWGFACFLWWVWHVLSRRESDRLRRPSPVTIAALAFVGTVLLSYVFAMLRAVPADEVLPADRGLLRMISFLGVVLVAADGIRSFSRLIVLLKRIVVLAGFVALVGVLEFATDTPIGNAITIPGLSGSGDASLQVRGEFVRPTATAAHALEYATMLSVAFPIALMLALRSRGRTRATMFVCAALIGMALLLAGSRSAILGLVIGVIPLLAVLGGRERLMALFGGIAAVVAVYVTVPGMLGTLRNMFQSAGSDTSVLSRTESLDVFGMLLPVSPWVGRGLGTLLPRYQIFDNQFLLLVLELGVIGALGFVALYAVAIVCVAACRTAPPTIAGIAAALAAGCLVAVSLSAFFDSFSFPKAFGLLALAPGLCAAVWGIAQSLPAQFSRPGVPESRIS
ncbi:O-antigen ligase [Microbacterium sp. 18062]|uniref:O-antigen ligase family protein n=1 Tax=Microbacterium sp. 18062 TaxID=2681410 RepID=UPI00135A67DE|nr:O-antigen ligase family protein [Microbacterium sp. 18062]